MTTETMTPYKCRRELKKRICSGDGLIDLFQECKQIDPSIDGYLLYNFVKMAEFCPTNRLLGQLNTLFMFGANPNAVYGNRPVIKTVLDLAWRRPDLATKAIDMAFYFVDYGADPNIRDSRGDTLLHHAMRHCLVFGDMIMVKSLLDRGADPNAKNKHGETPLHVLFRYGNCSERKAKIAEVLLECGADPRIRDKSGKTPLDYITDSDIAEKLISRYTSSQPSL
jgi:hypothetical protein